MLPQPNDSDKAPLGTELNDKNYRNCTHPSSSGAAGRDTLADTTVVVVLAHGTCQVCCRSARNGYQLIARTNGGSDTKGNSNGFYGAGYACELKLYDRMMFSRCSLLNVAKAMVNDVAIIGSLRL